MTADEWDTCTDTVAMLLQLDTARHRRKVRLFAVACCRQLGRWVADPRLWDVLAAVEQYADGQIGDAELDPWTAVANLSWSTTDFGPRQHGHAARIAVHQAFAFASMADRYRTTAEVPVRLLRVANRFGKSFAGRLSVLLPVLLRDIVGNPLRPFVWQPDWCSEPAVALARTMYDARTFDRMPILADALEEAGCEVPAVLAHCRDPGAVHVRGCWVVDGILGYT